MPDRANVTELRDILAIEKCEPDASLVCVPIEDLAALLDVAEAARRVDKKGTRGRSTVAVMTGSRLHQPERPRTGGTWMTRAAAGGDK